MVNILEVKQRIEQLAKQIHATANLMPTYEHSRNDGTPHIEVDGSAYYYISLERDSKGMDRKTSDLDTLLYWAFEDITSSMATDYAMAQSGPKINFRKVRFEYQLSLLEVINYDWKERREKEIAEILKVSPYLDISSE